MVNNLINCQIFRQLIKRTNYLSFGNHSIKFHQIYEMRGKVNELLSLLSARKQVGVARPYPNINCSRFLPDVPQGRQVRTQYF